MRSIKPAAAKSRTLERGDLLLEKSGGGEKQPVGAVMLYDHDVRAVCSNFVARVTVASGFDSKYLCYLHYWLYSSRVNIRSVKQSTGIQNLDSYSYLNEVVATPEFPEQRKIAVFLDWETGKIDALVAKKKELIALLQEKRTALITHAVTKGLDPNAVMKDSGIEWIGEIPRGWKATKMRRHCQSIRDGTHNPPPRADGIHRLLSVRNIVNGEFVLRPDDRTMIAEDFAELQRSYTVQPGDVVLAIVGATTGKSAAVGILDNVTVQRSLAILRPWEGDLDSSFLNYWLRSDLLQQENKSTYDKYAAQPGIYLDDVSHLPLALPPIEVQETIVCHLDRISVTFDGLVGAIRDAIERLQELRTALISAAVTGKIDVREEVA